MIFNQILILGSGVIGCGWAARFASSGAQVFLFDNDNSTLKAGMSRLQDMARNMADIGLVENVDEMLQRCESVNSLNALPDGIDYVQECVPENPEIKKAVILEIDSLVKPDAVIASSTSALLPEQFLVDVPGRNRCLIAHPFNPPHIMPLVEVVKTPWVEQRVIDQTVQWLHIVGQCPIILNKAIPGFAANRLQAAVVNEAVSMVADGILSPREVDLCLTQALGLRWCFLGPFRTMDLNSPGGFLDYTRKFGDGYTALGRDMNPGREWADEVLQKIENELRSELSANQLSGANTERDTIVTRIRALLEQNGK